MPPSSTAPPDDPHKGLTPEQLKEQEGSTGRLSSSGDPYNEAGQSSNSELSLAQQAALEQRFPHGARDSSGRAAGREPAMDSAGGQAERSTAGPSDTGAAGKPAFDYRDELEGPDSKAKQNVKSFISRHRKGLAISGGLIGGGGGLAALGFFLLLPLKIDAVISRLDRFYAAAPTAAMQRIEDKLLNRYLARYVLPNIRNGRCGSTLELNCTSSVTGKGPVMDYFRALKDHHVEQTMAKKGIVFGKRGKQVYMSVNGLDVADDADFLKIINGETIEVNGEKQVATIFNVGEARKLNYTAEGIAQLDENIRTAYKGANLWDRTVGRWKFLKLLEAKYGIKLCFFKCSLLTKAKFAIADQKASFQAFLIDRVLSPFSDNLNVLAQCIATGGDFCSAQLEDIKRLEAGIEPEPTDVKLSPAQEKVQAILADHAAEYGVDDLADIVARAKAVEGKGVVKGLLTDTLEKFVTGLFGEEVGQTVAKTAGVVLDGVQVAGWILLEAKLIHSIDSIGPLLQHFNFAINAAAAVQLYIGFRTVDSEMRSGQLQSGYELQSFAQSLATNANNTTDGSADMATTPLYASIFGGGAVANSPYKCNDGSSVPTGKLVCPEEELNHGTVLSEALAAASTTASGVGKQIFGPSIFDIASVVSNISDLIGNIAGPLVNGLFETWCNSNSVCVYLSQQWTEVGKIYIPRITDWLVGKLIDPMVTPNMSGGRTFDVMAAGADVGANKSCQIDLGCKQITDQQAASIRNEQSAEDQADFAQMPFFARIFSTNTPYSLVSRVALSMPATPLTGLQDSFKNILSNPFGSLASLFGSLFNHSKSFAATPAQPDPFGVIQYGYPDDEIPQEPDTYWDQHCQGDFITDWTNKQPQDFTTGEPVATSTQACLLIQTGAQAGGAMLNPALLPPDAANPDQGN